jgi:hypothetical protein
MNFQKHKKRWNWKETQPSMKYAALTHRRIISSERIRWVYRKNDKIMTTTGYSKKPFQSEKERITLMETLLIVGVNEGVNIGKSTEVQRRNVRNQRETEDSTKLGVNERWIRNN